MLVGYDPWGFGNSFLRLPLEPTPSGRDQGCTCPHLSCNDCHDDPWRDSWITPKSTPGRTRKAPRRSASSAAHGWQSGSRHRLHRSHEDLLGERGNFPPSGLPFEGPPSQAFFNVPRQGGGLSRSVSCLSSSQRTLVKVEHDVKGHHHHQRQQQVRPLVPQPLSRSASCLAPHQTPRVARRVSRRGPPPPPPEVHLQRSKSKSGAFHLRPSKSDHSITMATRPLPPTPPEEGERQAGVESPVSSLHQEKKSKVTTPLEVPWVKADYYSKQQFPMRQGSNIWQRLSWRVDDSPSPTPPLNLNQDEQGYLEPLPPPLPPRRSEGGSSSHKKKWKCQDDTESCMSSCSDTISYIYRFFAKAASQCTSSNSNDNFTLLHEKVQASSTPPPPPPPQHHSNGTTTTTSATTMMPVRKVVVALYDYNAAQVGDLCLRKNEEFDVLDDSEEHWWKMRDNQGREGYAPSNYVREKGNLGLQQYEWYLGDASRQRAEAILMREEKEGCFVVRNSTTNSGIYTLSVFSKMSRVQVKHYHIKTDADGLFYLSNSIKCATIPELIYRHQHNPGGLCTRLRNPPSQGRQAPTTAGLSHDKWEIVPSELNLLEELGSGQFGVVRHGKLYGIDVAVKMMKEGTMSEDEFIEEAKVMTKLQHPNLVQLYGVCRRKRPIYIVTEYLKHGSLLNYLRNKEKSIIQKPDLLLDMCLQVCEGMAYLESQKFIHRDLAARNCLVGSSNVIKVGDFGLARYVVDDEYTGSGGAKFPIKWAAPEVLNYMRFSSKSDVWAFGVLMWEVFTCGKMPYGRHKNAEVVEMVQQGKILERPRFCTPEVYEVMKKCWLHSQEQRPGFLEIKAEILKVAKTFAE